MTAHKRAKMIKAKADNMDLVVLRKHHEGDWIEVADQSEIRIKQNGEYFLCLAKHKEACLHWLNGGDVLVKSKFVPSWEVVAHGQVWGDVIGWMREDAQYRIKPRTEKRWIAIRRSDLFVEDCLFHSVENAIRQGYPESQWQLHEIEVEV